MTLDLKQIRAFLAVADELGFARAADALDIAQPALSRRVAALEAALGCRLLHRTSRRVAPTAAGEAFAREARAVLAGVDAAIEAARRADAGLAGEIDVGYNDFAIAGPLPEIAQAFRHRRPDVRLRLHRASTDAHLDAVAQGRVDVAFVIAPARSGGLAREIVWRERLVAVMAEHHPVATDARVTLADLAGEPHVLGEHRRWRAFRERLRRLYDTVDAFPEVAAEGPESSVILGLVAAGVGVTVYPECVETALRRGLAIRPIAGGEATLETALVWRGDTRSAATLGFVETVRRVVAGWPDGFYRAAGERAVPPAAACRAAVRESP